MPRYFKIFSLIIALSMAFCVPSSSAQNAVKNSVEEPKKGPHRGRLLLKDNFSLELGIFERGVPPEFRVWITNNNKPVNPKEVSLKVTLTRLGGITDHIQFKAQDDFLRGDTEIYEPHSFIVAIDAEYLGKKYSWQYENFEGRTLIKDEIAKELKIGTSIAGGATIQEKIQVYGKLSAHPEQMREIAARFDGFIEKVYVDLGQKVKKGEKLITIENNESLESYTIISPIDGVVTLRNAYNGEQTNGRILFMISNINPLIAELAVFPKNRTRVSSGNKVSLKVKGIDKPFEGVITHVDAMMQANQSVTVRAELKNDTEILVPGAFAIGDIEIKEHHVPLAVKRSALQSFRDFTVVYAKVGEEYEVRMLELGKESDDLVEVLSGLKPGTEYVAENSYIIKADIDKSGASHDH